MAIEARRLTKTYGSLVAVDDLDLSVVPGEIFGFLGPNGAGKSTTIKMLCTLATPSGGTARVAGYDTVAEPLEVRRRIGLVFQDPTVDAYLTADQNLQFHAELYGLDRSAAAQRIDEVLDMVQLADRRSSKVETFSGGMRRRLEIARGLVHSPAILFLDEPTVGLDPQTRSRIWEYINELRVQTGITIFLTTHYMDEAEHCDRIAIIDHGSVVTVDTPAALKAQVGTDTIRLTTLDDAAVMPILRDRFNLDPIRRDGQIICRAANGHELVPQLCSDLGVAVASVDVSRPTLDDVFMAHTGRTIRDAEADALEHSRAVVAALRRRS
ncbi:MAG: ABC transporter ATP-binding protein [Ilumatobacter coccineus]|uniref:ABC transporter ATP-binding protein n=1 Tax=Ilumatobacter coccineus TaxID=467094 RepID=A0A2G6KBP6_9ACTN|nr:MAG: ABC transporter ATP-binding protein [Ilumatobacter coccineus]